MVAALAAPAAHAEEVFTSQAAATHATDSTWIAPPAQRAAVCIVDTGVDPNPDTANVVARLDVTGGDGSDVSSQKHGTRMAMIAAAPYNGFGMVGAAPSINVVSVRAMRPDSGETFSTTDFTSAIQSCRLKRNIYNIRVVAVALGGQWDESLNAVGMAYVQSAVDNARASGLNVVAAAGNHPGPLDWPAAYAPVLAVGAAASTGAKCSFAAFGNELDIWAPGCPQDVVLADGRAAWASGSSEAAAYAAAILTQLRGLRPDLGVDEAERLLTRGTGDGAAMLDVSAAFEAAGLSASLAQGRAAIPAPGVPSPAPPAPPAPVTVGPSLSPTEAPDTPMTTAPVISGPSASKELQHPRLPAPRVRAIRVHRGVLTLTFVGKPRGVQARVQVYARRPGRTFPTLVRSLRLTDDRLRVKISGTVTQVSMTYRDPTGTRRASAPLTVRP